jgi:dTDP-4-dehydrorhamnose reductase
MRVLILGAGGLLGHMLVRICQSEHEVFGTSRSQFSSSNPLARFLPEQNWVGDVDVLTDGSIIGAIRKTEPSVVINCIGVTKQRPSSADQQLSTIMNSKFPFELSVICEESKCRLIHLSTDCVFSGSTGMYADSASPDPTDVYGSTKAAGELDNDHDLTIRTSFVGRELQSPTNLFEWIIRQRGESVRGFTNAIYSGFTTEEFSKIVNQVITSHHSLHGLFNVASEPINKYELICQLNAALNLGIDVIPDGSFHCDRSLDGSRFKDKTGIRIPSWPEMIEAFVQDQGAYADIGA